MTVVEIIHSLEDQAQDKDKLAEGDPESIFTQDAEALREAAKLLGKHHAPESNEPLTSDDLRDMRGEPVFCEELQCWGIIKIDPAGHWANKPFLVGSWHDSDTKFSCNFEYDIAARNLTLYRRRPEETGSISTEELLDFCAKREVEIYTRYDFICDSLIVKMRKKNLETQTAISRESAGSKGFGLTIRVILRGMADKLDKGGGEEQ